MTEQSTLEKILENTEVVKEVIVTKENDKQNAKTEKKEKRKEQLKTAQDKFVQIKASVKPELKEKIVAKAQDGNVQGYLMKLVENDLSTTPSLFEEAPEKTNDLEAENAELKKELDRIKNMNFIQKLKFLF